MTYAAYACPDNYATQTKTKILEAATLKDAIFDLIVAKCRDDEFDLLMVEEDGDAADAAFAKAGAIYLFTIEKE